MYDVPTEKVAELIHAVGLVGFKAGPIIGQVRSKVINDRARELVKNAPPEPELIEPRFRRACGECSEILRMIADALDDTAKSLVGFTPSGQGN